MKLVSRTGQRERETGLAAIGSLLRSRKRKPAVSDPGKEAHDIGARSEHLNEKLDLALRSIAQVSDIAALLQQMRDPIADEFAERRAEHAALQTVRAEAAATAEKLGDLQLQHRELIARLAAADTALAAAASEAEGQAIRLGARESQLQDMRSDRDQLRAQLGELSAAHREAMTRLSHLEEESTDLKKRLESSEQRRREREAQLATEQQARQLLEQENAVLSKRCDHVGADCARLTSLTSQLEESLTVAQARCQALDSALLAAESEAAKAARAFEARLESAGAEKSALDARLEMALARNTQLETTGANLNERLAEVTAQHSSAERARSEVALSLERAKAESETVREELQIARLEMAALEQARSAAVERADELSQLAHSRDLVIRRTEHRLEALKERLDNAQAEHVRKRAGLEERLTALQGQLEEERAARGVAEGSLETARRDRSRLQGELLDSYEPGVALAGE